MWCSLEGDSSQRIVFDVRQARALQGGIVAVPGHDVDNAGFNFFLPGSDWPDTVRPAWVANRFFIFLYRNANKITL